MTVLIDAALRLQTLTPRLQALTWVGLGIGIGLGLGLGLG